MNVNFRAFFTLVKTDVAAIGFLADAFFHNEVDQV
jgi:hypothetical protein